MQIRFPRKLRSGFRPVYGLTVRQLIYLALFGIVGGLMILAGPIQGASILVRAVFGIAIMVTGLALAFLRIAGLSLDAWLPIGARYFLRPRRRVWRKRDVARPVVNTPNPAPAPEPTHKEIRTRSMTNPKVVPIPTKRVLVTTAIVAIDAFMLVVIGVTTLYLKGGGLAQVQITLAQWLR